MGMYAAQNPVARAVVRAVQLVQVEQTTAALITSSIPTTCVPTTSGNLHAFLTRPSGGVVMVMVEAVQAGMVMVEAVQAGMVMVEVGVPGAGLSIGVTTCAVVTK
jgi:hypothetical protein